MRELGAVIAGNDSGSRVASWVQGLRAAAPEIEPIAIDVPSRKDAADAALIMELGANLERHLARGDLVVVVSRDDLLVGAAEHAKQLGCRALAAYVDSNPPCARRSRVATLLLPTPGKQRTSKPPTRPLVSTLPRDSRETAAPPPATAGNAQPPATPEQAPAAILAQLRMMCTPAPKRGYSATDVGQALHKLGYDAPARRRFLATTPGIQTQGQGTSKIYRL